MTAQHQGRWKEGRWGAASLCYLDLDNEPELLEMVSDHHAAVGIRATLRCRTAHLGLQHALAQRNWDFASPAENPTESDQLQPPDQQPGIIVDQAEATPLATLPNYLVINSPGPISEQLQLAQPLPSFTADPEVTDLKHAINQVVEAQQWGIWRFDAHGLRALGRSGHQQLLNWLGEHHMHIWCAPIRDIHRWYGQQTQ